jgi:hypothetical protein
MYQNNTISAETTKREIVLKKLERIKIQERKELE